MKIAVTGGSGRIGSAISARALAEGHSVVSIDRVEPPEQRDHDNLRFVLADIVDYDALLGAFAGCDAVIHMAAIPSPFQLPDHTTHNNNVTGSYNAMRAAAEHGIMRFCQASSVNAVGLSFSRDAHFDYFPLDEEHPTYAEEAYGLSKWICEQQADSFARRYEGMRLSSMRFHLVIADRETAGKYFNFETPEAAKHLWGYTRYDAAADACLRSLEAPFTGHEVFYIVAPDTTFDIPTLDLAKRFFPDVPVKGDLSGTRSFFNSSKAERMLGWRHNAALDGA